MCASPDRKEGVVGVIRSPTCRVLGSYVAAVLVGTMPGDGRGVLITVQSGGVLDTVTHFYNRCVSKLALICWARFAVCVRLVSCEALPCPLRFVHGG